jgi:hypothetical protein
MVPESRACLTSTLSDHPHRPTRHFAGALAPEVWTGDPVRSPAQGSGGSIGPRKLSLAASDAKSVFPTFARLCAPLLVGVIGGRDPARAGWCLIGCLGSAALSQKGAHGIGHGCGFGEVGHVGAGELDQLGAALGGQPGGRLVEEVVGAGRIAALVALAWAVEHAR